MRTCALLLACLSLGFAPAPFPRPDSPKSDLKNLQGEWVRVQCIVNGQPLIKEGARTTTAVIAGNRLTYAGVPMATYEWAIALGPKKKPKILDMKGLAGAEKGMTYWGVYRLDGDTLTVCSCKGASESVRPADIKGVGPGVLIEVFMRRKR